MGTPIQPDQRHVRVMQCFAAIGGGEWLLASEPKPNEIRILLGFELTS
jgi:hypothetical protein